MRALSVSALAGAAFLAASAALAGPAVEPLVSDAWLKAHLNDPEVVVLDVRHQLAGTTKADYEKGHIPGAVWTDYPTGWRVERDGIPHVVPSLETIEANLGNLGIDETKTVVVVPSGTNATEFGSAARIYWTLKYLGHDAVAILDGGTSGWMADAANPVEKGAVAPVPTIFTATVRDELLATTADVRSLMEAKSALLVDGRPEEEFRGFGKHPQATRYGHIPGALNLDQAKFYDSRTNRLRPREELAKIVPASMSSRSEPIVSYCNTGHWAATNWFVLSELLGYKNIRLYDASMVGWSRDAALPMDSERTRLDDLMDWFRKLTS